jgi:hypothetical protein
MLLLLRGAGMIESPFFVLDPHGMFTGDNYGRSHSSSWDSE